MSQQPEPHEVGLVDIYVNEVRSLAVKALAGENVEQATCEAVEKAAQHFAVIVGTTEIANLRAFAGPIDHGRRNDAPDAACIQGGGGVREQAG